MTPRTYTAAFPFGGSGFGAMGFARAEGRVQEIAARFRIVGGIDFNDAACLDFVELVDAPSLCADVAKLRPADLRRVWGDTAPDVVFLSPPCKGASGLISEELARTEKYAAMNRLALTWTELMLAAWEVPPRAVLLENVPRLRARAPETLDGVCALLRKAGYRLHEGFHDCGELGGLAQHRRRFLLVARHERSVPTLLYEPPRRRVRGCGEVLGEMPMPGDPAGGPMHALPRLSWKNWVRLGLIPAGGDWRDLPGVLEGKPRRAKFRRQKVMRWEDAADTVTGPGGSAVDALADPRVKELLVRKAFDHGYGVLRWDEASPTVAGGSDVGQGAYSVADPRLGCEPRSGAYGVLRWDEAAATITGSACIDNGRMAVADPRVQSAPPDIPIIIAADGTWHRPLTTLELAVLQGVPWMHKGRPLKLAGSGSTAWRERIGNGVPPPAAEAIAEQILTTLLAADLGAFTLSATGIWVTPECAAEART